MAKTDIFRKLINLLRDAKIAHEHKLTDEQIREKIEENLESQSRRDFMKQTALTGAAISGASLLSPHPLWAANAADPANTVAILGAGAAGLAAAYNLRKAGVPFIIYDAQQRVGGRMWTARNFNKDGQFVEMGGELVDSPHFVLRALAKELSVGLERFAAGDKGFQGDIFFSGKVYSHAQIVSNLQPFLDLVNAAIEELFTGVGDDYITFETADKHVRKYDNMTLKTFLYSPQMTKNVEKFILDFINAAYLAEYGRETEEQPAINLLYLIGTEIVDNDFELFGLSDEAFRIKGGSDKLTTAMFNNITNNGALAPQLMSLSQKLTGVSYRGGKFYFRFDGKNKETTGYKYVICTIPFTTLKNVEGIEKLAFSERKRIAILGGKISSGPDKGKTISPFGIGQNSKVFLTFKNRVWRKDTPTIGRNIGSFYGANDFKRQCYWESSRLQAGSRGVLTNFVGGKLGLTTTDANVPDCLNDLVKLYPKIRPQYEAHLAPLEPKAGTAKQTVNWNKNPNTLGSYGCVLLGQWSTLVGALGRPELNKQMHFAGEHTSLDYQGYMEGGFESGMRAANAIIHKVTGKKPQNHYVWAENVLWPKK